MKNIKTILITLLILFSSSATFAHALWIETASSGKLGQKHNVKVFYGEFIANERDSVSKWYSDLKEVRLWLVGPDQKKVQLSLTPGVNFVETSFTPEQNGGYMLLISHEAKELGGATKYHFLSSATVSVGNTLADIKNNSNVLSLHSDDIHSARVNKALKLNANLKSAAASGKAVTVFSSNGWSKELITDVDGNLNITPLWKGRYVVEIMDTDKTPGQHNGKDYMSTWKGATYSFEVK